MNNTTDNTKTTGHVHRIEVRMRPDQPDPRANELLHEARSHGLSVSEVRVADVYLIDAAVDHPDLVEIADALLTDPVTQRHHLGTSDPDPTAISVEVHYLPGVMDPVAMSVEQTIEKNWSGANTGPVQVRTGRRYDILPESGQRIDKDNVAKLAAQVLANPVVQSIQIGPHLPQRLSTGQHRPFELVRVPILDLDDTGLQKLSREAHLFLDLREMRAIQDYYRSLDNHGREPTDIELETLAQTWSEHCVHKTLKSTVRYSQTSNTHTVGPHDWDDRPGHELRKDGSLVITNILKSTIAAATRRLMKDPDIGQWCVSVFDDNAGIVRLDDDDAVCIKVETHNHPSALEPYGGAATGIGGCIRDIMGTGLSALPIASTDVFCVAFPERPLTNTGTPTQPKGVIPPKRILQQVVAGIRDYGNRIGIPTVNGAVWFDERFIGNPLVFAGCVGLIPLDKCFGKPAPGDRIVALGGRTGRDGIHGATFSSAALTDSHADEFSHAVQIGNPITQKKMLDVIIAARDHESGPLFSAITDCGAGGFSSAIGEMGQEIGARVALEQAPLKYDGLTYTEVWISEAQERMVLAVNPSHMNRLRELCDSEDVEMCDLGFFGCAGTSDEPTLVLEFEGNEVGRLSMHFLHEGIPTPTREANWSPPDATSPPPDNPLHTSSRAKANSITDCLHALLRDPNIASKHWIIRQYDHEVQGCSVVKPLVGRDQDGPSDAAVVKPKIDGQTGIAIACGLQPGLSENGPNTKGDPYWMALAAIDEAIRNCICCGAQPGRIALLDNFCWPSCDSPDRLGSLVRAAEGCYDGAIAYRAPFVSGKDSLNNQFAAEDGRLIAIPPTLLITALGIVRDINQCRTMDAKQPGNALIIVGQTDEYMGGAHLFRVSPTQELNTHVPRVSTRVGPATAKAVADLIATGLVQSAHDCSDGGLLVAAAEMAFAGHFGLSIDLAKLPSAEPLPTLVAAFAETPSRYLLEARLNDVDTILKQLCLAEVPAAVIGEFNTGQRLTVQHEGKPQVDEPLDALRAAWLEPLDW